VIRFLAYGPLASVVWGTVAAVAAGVLGGAVMAAGYGPTWSGAAVMLATHVLTWHTSGHVHLWRARSTLTHGSARRRAAVLPSTHAGERRRESWRTPREGGRTATPSTSDDARRCSDRWPTREEVALMGTVWLLVGAMAAWVTR